MRKSIKIVMLGIVIIAIAGFVVPQDLRMPVAGANANSYNHETFWHEGWGSSVVHKGVDIFAKRGTPIHSSTRGIVVAASEGGKGGKYVVILGPKWRLHYYAHLDEITTKPFALVSHDTVIGTVGNTGNAATTPAHLHYSIATLVPYPWRIDDAPVGWQKMFYLNPIEYLDK